MPETSGKRIYFGKMQEFGVSWNNILKELDHLFKDFTIKFELLINTLNGGSLQNIIHFSTGGLDDPHVEYGYKCPAVWLRFDDDDFKLYVESAINRNPSMHMTLKKTLREGEWMNIEISQFRDKENKYKFEFKVNDRIFWSVENGFPVDFNHVKIHAGNWFKPVDGRIRNMEVETVDSEFRKNNPDRYGHGRRH
eukprot:TRINITY_DN7499_c0_g1_i4.p1 TRINITY_DN7499_c0_g1~~TRINITY_DN7499_c0_g1_i4.p1  ORF type:complete len:194 (-),score=34.84 TRINITY_DN7499_c0_g1_i4:174-755(-)